MYCLQCFSLEDIFIRHKENCIIINGKQAIKMPEKGSILKFNNFHKQLPIPFVIYADFDTITKKYMVVDQIMISRIQNHINSMKAAATIIKLFVNVMIINIVSQYRFIEAKGLYTILWKRC